MPGRAARIASLALGGGVALAGAVFFVVRVLRGLRFLPFADESETILGAKAILGGQTLYGGYVTTHGPLPYALAHAWYALVSADPLDDARLVPAGLAGLAAIAVAASPALAGPLARLQAAALFLGLTACVWMLQALFMLSFYPIAGFLAVIGIALFAAPAWRGARIGDAAALLAGAAFALVLFAAYSMAPGIALLALSGWIAAGRWRSGVFCLAGGALASAAMLAWLLRFGDLRGLVAFHLLENQRDYAGYIDFGLAAFLRGLALSAEPFRLVHSFALLALAVALALFAALPGPWRRRASLLPGFAGALLLNARGSFIFQDGTMLAAAIGLLALAVPPVLAALPVPRPLATGLVALLVAGVELAGRGAVATPFFYTRAQMDAAPYLANMPAANAEFEKVRRIVHPDEPMLALPYAPIIYLLADRLPMPKYYEYFPWDADYARAPVLGKDRDLCVDLKAAPPPLIWFNDEKIFGRYAPEQYMSCVLAILADRYVRQTDFPELYVRRDRAAP